MTVYEYYLHDKEQFESKNNYENCFARTSHAADEMFLRNLTIEEAEAQI